MLGNPARALQVALGFAAAVWCGGSAIGSLVVAGGTATSEGTSSTTDVFGTGSATYQWYYSPSQLGNPAVGTTIDGIAFRLDTPAGKSQSSEAQFVWSLTLSQIATTVSDQKLDTTAANNIGAHAVTVLSYAGDTPADTLDVKAGTYTFSNKISPQAFAKELVFTAPYAYAGGDLLLTVQSQLISGAALPGMDAAPVAGNANTVLANYNVNGYGGYATAIPIAQLDANNAPEPTALVALPVFSGLLGLARRRRVRSC